MLATDISANSRKHWNKPQPARNSSTNDQIKIMSKEWVGQCIAMYGKYRTISISRLFPDYTWPYMGWYRKKTCRTLTKHLVKNKINTYQVKDLPQSENQWWPSKEDIGRVKRWGHHQNLLPMHTSWELQNTWWQFFAERSIWYNRFGMIMTNSLVRCQKHKSIKSNNYCANTWYSDLCWWLMRYL